MAYSLTYDTFEPATGQQTGRSRLGPETQGCVTGET